MACSLVIQSRSSLASRWLSSGTITSSCFTGVMHAGNSKLVIQSATVRDATGSLAAAAGTDAGAVLTLWNPDESWSRDALLRVNAVLGPATRTHTIYEHIEVVVHPLGVHLNEAVASAFWVRPCKEIRRTLPLGVHSCCMLQCCMQCERSSCDEAMFRV